MGEYWIDGSRWQSRPDFVAVKSSGIAGVVWNDLDPGYASRCQEAAAAGLLVGTYHYLGQNENAAGAAQAMVGRANATGVAQALLALDIEEGDGDQSGRALTFLHTTQSDSGKLPWVYSGNWFIPGRLTDPVLAAFPLWDASYGSQEPQSPYPWTSIAMWQFTSSARIPGIIGNVDENRMFWTIGVNPTTGGAITVADLDPALITRGLVAWFLDEHGVKADGPAIDWFLAHAHDVGAGQFEWEIEGALGGNDTTQAPQIAQSAQRLRQLGQGQVPDDIMAAIKAAK